MIRQREKVIEKVSVVFQTLLSFCCFYISIHLVALFTNTAINVLQEYYNVSYLIVPLWYLLLGHFGMGKMLRMKMYSIIYLEYMAILFLGAAILFIYIGMMKFTSISRIVLVLFFVMDYFALLFYKLFVYWVMKILREHGYNYRQIVFIADDDSDFFIDRTIAKIDWGYKIQAIITDSLKIKQKYQHRYMIYSESEPLSSIIDQTVTDEVLFCKGTYNQDDVRNIINECAEVGITFRLQSELLNIVSSRSYISYVDHFPFLTFMNTPNNYLALKFKSIMDFIIALWILIIISPVLLLIIAAIKIDDGGSVLFKQTRVGKNGRLFKCLKFRTMVENAEVLKAALMDKNEQQGPVFKMKNDPRVTKVGKFLRKTSLDELPQFFNVLKGEMSIVGPRPPVPSEVEKYERWQRRRLSMKPGLTCIWQVSGRNSIPFEQWMKMDMQYIDSWSLKLDLLLFFKTFKVLVVRDGQ